MTTTTIIESDFMHANDRLLTKQLNENYVFSKLSALLSSAYNFSESYKQNIDYIKVTESNLPSIYNVTKRISDSNKFALPSTYIMESNEVNAMTFGDKHKSFILITSKLLDVMSIKEIEFIVGHEMGHIVFNHAPINTLLNVCFNFASGVSEFLPIKNSFVKQGIIAGSKSLFFALKQWEKFAEVSCDRYGYAVCNDIDASTKALMKLKIGTIKNMEINVDDYVQQFMEAKDNIFSNRTCNTSSTT